MKCVFPLSFGKVVVGEVGKMEEERKEKRGKFIFQTFDRGFSLMFTLSFQRTQSGKRSRNHNYQIVVSSPHL